MKRQHVLLQIVSLRRQVPHDRVHDSPGREVFRSPVCSGPGHDLFRISPLVIKHGQDCSPASQVPVHCGYRCHIRLSHVVLCTRTLRGCGIGS